MSKLVMSTVQKRIFNIVSTEQSYYNSNIALKILHFSTYAFVVFTIFLSVINLFSVEVIKQTEYYLNFSLIIFGVLTFEMLIYKVLVKFFLGFDFGLVMFHTAFCYAVNIFTGYCFFRCLWNWMLEGYIVYNLDYAFILDRVIQNSFGFAAMILAGYLIIMIIGVINDRVISPNIWRIAVIFPIIAMLVSAFLIIFIPRSLVYNYSVVICQVYFGFILYLVVRYLVQLLFHFLTISRVLERLERPKKVVEKVDTKYFGKVITIEDRYKQSIEAVGEQFTFVKTAGNSLAKATQKGIENIHLKVALPEKAKKLLVVSKPPAIDKKPVGEIELKEIEKLAIENDKTKQDIEKDKQPKTDKPNIDKLKEPTTQTDQNQISQENQEVKDDKLESEMVEDKNEDKEKSEETKDESDIAKDKGKSEESKDESKGEQPKDESDIAKTENKGEDKQEETANSEKEEENEQKNVDEKSSEAPKEPGIFKMFDKIKKKTDDKPNN